MINIDYTNEFLNGLNKSKMEKIAVVLQSKDEQTKKELELIERIQKYNDPIAMQKMVVMYRGTINNAIRGSGLLSVMDEANANQEAINIFREKIKQYQLNDYIRGVSKATPLTYITSTLTPSLQKINYNNSGSGVRMSEELRGINKNKYTAEQLLERQLNRKPTYGETLQFMKNEMGVKNKNLSESVLKRIDNYKTNEYSGSQTINGADGAEKLTLSEVTSTSGSIKDMYEKQLEEDMVEDEIKKFTQDNNKQKFLKMNFGLGEFKNNKSRSINEASFNCGLTYYEANKLAASFREHINNSKRGG